MNILIIGSGGREHTLAWKIKQSPLCNALFIAPGNAGTESCGTNLPIAINDFAALQQAAIDHQIELIVVGPEEPLVKGLVDYFAAQPSTQHIHIIGPSQQAAQLEGSKAFAKAFMKKYSLPTAAYREFAEDEYEEGLSYIQQHSLPIVLKADGLAAGKGVLICTTHEEALLGFEQMLLQSKFGEAGKKVVIEAFLEGIEMSVFVLTDGKEYVMLPEAKDYKRIGEGDTGLNTGGMGAVSPVPFFDEALRTKVMKRIVKPTIAGIQQEQFTYVGFVFIGLMIANGDPYIIEYNCRMGDPETEVVIPRIQNDLVELLLAAATHQLGAVQIEAKPLTAVTTVAVSGGYPEAYTNGKPIEGLALQPIQNTQVFHAGTILKDQHVVTNGGRVLAVTAFGQSVHEAAAASRTALGQLHFEGMNYRRDIGYEF